MRVRNSLSRPFAPYLSGLKHRTNPARSLRSQKVLAWSNLGFRVTFFSHTNHKNLPKTVGVIVITYCVHDQFWEVNDGLVLVALRRFLLPLAEGKGTLVLFTHKTTTNIFLKNHRAVISSSGKRFFRKIFVVVPLIGQHSYSGCIWRRNFLSKLLRLLIHSLKMHILVLLFLVKMVTWESDKD